MHSQGFGFGVTLLMLGSCWSSAQDFSSGVTQNSAIPKLGAGYDPENPDRYIAPCLTLPAFGNATPLADKKLTPIKTPSGTTYYDFKLVSSAEQLYSALNVDINASFKSRVFKLSASYSLEKELNIANNDLVFVMTAGTTYQPITIEQQYPIKDSIVQSYKMSDRFTDDYRDLYYPDFKQACGSFYINSITKSSNVSLIINLKSNSEKELEELRTKLDVSFKGLFAKGSLSASLDDLKTAFSAAKTIEIRFRASGGRGITDLALDTSDTILSNAVSGSGVDSAEVQKINANIIERYIKTFNTYAKQLDWENSVPISFGYDLYRDALPRRRGGPKPENEIISVYSFNQKAVLYWAKIYLRASELYNEALDLPIVITESPTKIDSNDEKIVISASRPLTGFEREELLRIYAQYRAEYIKQLTKVMKESFSGALKCNREISDLCELPQYTVITRLAEVGVPVTKYETDLPGSSLDPAISQKIKGYSQSISLDPKNEKYDPIPRLDYQKISKMVLDDFSRKVK